MTELPKPPKRSPNLYERIRAHVERVGGIDLELPPRELGREPPDFARADYDQPPPTDISAGTDANQQNGPDSENAMKHADFRVGETFWCSGHRWRCTDIGTRIITAIKLNHEDDPSWYNGPPYAVAESVFDEYDIEGCSLEAPSDADLPPSKMEPDAGNDAEDDDWFGPRRQAKRIAQAQSLRDQARAGGLRFDAYLPPSLAEWLLGHIERGTFTDPSEATFVMLGEQRELEPHADLRREFLNRRIQAGIDSGPGRPAEEVFEELRKSLAEPRPQPAVWRKEP